MSTAKKVGARKTPPPGPPPVSRYLVAALLVACAAFAVTLGLYLHVLAGAGLLVLVCLATWSAVRIARQMRRDARRVQRYVARLRYAEARTRGVLATAGDGIITIDEAGVVKSFNRAAGRIFGYRPREVFGRGISLLLTPHGAANVGTGEAKILGSDAELLGKRKDGTTFPVEPAVSKIRLGRRRRFTYVLRDLTERRRVEEELRQARDELEQRVRERTSQLAAANQQNQLILQAAGEGILGLDRDGRVTFANPAAAHVSGWRAEDLIGRPLQETLYPPDPLAGAEAPPPPDAGAAPRVDHALFRRKDGFWFPVQCVRTAIREAGAAVGAVVLFQDITERRQAEERLHDYAERLQALSRQLLATQELERRHLARELHDEIGQTLTAIKLNVQAARTARGGQAPLPGLEESLAIVDQAIAQVRNLSLDLRPSLLDDLGLVPALRWYVERQAQRAGFAADLDAVLETRLPPDLETACFRVVQEALTNVSRHARARRVSVRLHQEDEGLELNIRDDGSGFDVAAARGAARRGGSLGLLGMQERVQLLGGTLAIQSAAGQGTEIRIRFPQPAPEPAAGVTP